MSATLVANFVTGRDIISALAILLNKGATLLRALFAPFATCMFLVFALLCAPYITTVTAMHQRVKAMETTTNVMTMRYTAT